jgi:hypothetical protein
MVCFTVQKMSWSEAFVTILSSPFSGPINSLAFCGILAASCVARSAALFAWNNFRVFVLNRLFPSRFALDLKTLGSWAGKYQHLKARCLRATYRRTVSCQLFIAAI